MSTETLRTLQRKLTQLEAARSSNSHFDRQELHDTVVAIYEEERLIARWDRQHAEAAQDPTGQDLDAFYGEE